MSDTATGNDASVDPALARWQEARRHVRAARAILSDDASAPRSCVTHLVGAWQQIVSLADSDELVAEDDLADRIAHDAIPGLSTGQRAATAASVATLVETNSLPLWQSGERCPDRPHIVAQLRTLERLLPDLDRDLLAARAARHARKRWLIRAAITAAVLAAILAKVCTNRATPTGPWHGAYYAGEFARAPTIRRDTTIDFDWGEEPPLDQLGIDRFSIRWTSCLLVGEASTATFALTADEGARLYIDNLPRIDAWKNHTGITATAEVELSAGVHPIHVEFREQHGEAFVLLQASFGDYPLEPLPARMLRYPGDSFEPNNPCARILVEDENGGEGGE